MSHWLDHLFIVPVLLPLLAGAATLLLEPELTYEQLIRVMDTVRVVPVQQDERIVYAELFPDVSIGDAPQLRRGS